LTWREPEALPLFREVSAAPGERWPVLADCQLWVLLIRIFPPIVVGIPYFTVLERFGLTDTQLGLVIVHVSLTLPFVIWLMLGFFQDVPADLEKAATLDGCSLWRRFWRISLPLVLPGLAVTAIFAFIEGFYNTHRRHSALGYLPPAQFERQVTQEMAA